MHVKNQSQLSELFLCIQVPSSDNKYYVVLNTRCILILSHLLTYLAFLEVSSLFSFSLRPPPSERQERRESLLTLTSWHSNIKP